MCSEEFSVTSSALVGSPLSLLNFVIVFTLGLKTGSTFSSIASMGLHVVVIKAFFTYQTEMVSSHESFQGGTCVIMFSYFDENDIFSMRLVGTLVNDSVILIDGDYDQSVIG